MSSGCHSGKPVRKRSSPCGKAHHQRGEVLGLGCVGEPRRVLGVLRRQRRAAEAVEDHHRAPDAGLSQPLQRVQRRGVGLALVDFRQHCVVARFRPDIGQRQPGVGKLAQLGHRLLAQVARQAVAGDAMHPRQMPADRAQHLEQAPRRQHQRIAVGEEDAADLGAEAFPAAAYRLQRFGFIAGAELFLRRRVHLAEGTTVPRAAVGDRQDQRIRLARRAKYRVDVADGKLAEHDVASSPAARAASKQAPPPAGGGGTRFSP